MIDFWKEPIAPGLPVDFMVKPEIMEELQTAMEEGGLSFTVAIPNVQTLIDEQKRNLPKHRRVIPQSVLEFDYSVYHTADEVYQWIDLVAEEFSDITTKHQFGITYEGRPLYVLEFKTEPASSTKPIIFIDALIHCREWISMASLLFIFKEMLTNPAYEHMMQQADWYFVPMINVDGYVETWNGDRLWRKTMSTGPSSLCGGTDANRNWDAGWSGPGASSFPCMYTYYGPTAASESEVRHLSNFVLSLGVGEIDAYISTHSYSQLILYPYGYTTEAPADDSILNITGKIMHDAIYDVHQQYYTWGSTSTVLYVASGATTDWTYDVANVPLTYTYELRDTGRYGFLLPADQIIPNGEEFLAGIEALKNYVINNQENPSGNSMTD